MKKTNKILCFSISVLVFFSVVGCDNAPKSDMKITVKVSSPDIIRALAGNSKDPFFAKVMDQALEMERQSTKDFITLFDASFKKNNTSYAKMATFFIVGLKNKIQFNSSDGDVIAAIRAEIDYATKRTVEILKIRLDEFDCKDVIINRPENSDIINIELKGVHDPDRAKKIIQAAGKLEFWETYEYKDIYSFFDVADKKLCATLSNLDTSIVVDTSMNSFSSLETAANNDTMKNTDGKEPFDEYAAKHPLLAYLQPALVQDASGNYYPNKGPVVGYCLTSDTARVMELIHNPNIQMIFPRDLFFKWSLKAVDKKGTTYQLIALKSSRDGTSALSGYVVVDASFDIDKDKVSQISLSMNSEGAIQWKRLTGNNIGKSIAIVLDNAVYSFPTVQSEIPDGKSSITGNFTLIEAMDLVNLLKSGMLPAPVSIISAEVYPK